MDSIFSWFILFIGTLVSGAWLLIKAISEKERYKAENAKFFAENFRKF